MAAWEESANGGHPPHHLVQFYDDDESLLVTKIAHYLREGWRSGEALLSVAGTERNLAIGEELAALGVDVPAAVNSGRLLFCSAEETIDRLCDRGVPQWSRFDAVLGASVRERCQAHGGLRAYGEMVGILWKRGDYAGASRIEEFWNRLLKSCQVTLFCSYPIDMLAQDFDHPAVQHVISSHTHVLPVGKGELGQAVDRAMADVLGSRAHSLRRIVHDYFRPSAATLPSPEGMVLWLRTNLPQYAGQILSRARHYYRQA